MKAEMADKISSVMCDLAMANIHLAESIPVNEEDTKPLESPEFFNRLVKAHELVIKAQKTLNDMRADI